MIDFFFNLDFMLCEFLDKLKLFLKICKFVFFVLVIIMMDLEFCI